MRNLISFSPIALGLLALPNLATAQQTHEYFMWGGTPQTPEWEIRRTVDEDYNGDYFGPTEGWQFAYDGSNEIDFLQAIQYRNVAGVPSLFAVASGDVVLKFVDLDGNGDALTPGEWTVFVDTRFSHGVSNTSPDDLAFDPSSGVLYVTDDNWNSGSQPGSGLSSYVDFNGDGDATDAGEMTYFVNAQGSQTVAGTAGQVAIDLGDFEAIMVDSAGTVISFAQQDLVLYAFEDQNGDGDAMDSGEAWNFCNLVGDTAGLEQNADTLSGALKNPSCPSTTGVGLYASLEILDVDHGAGPGGIDIYWIVSTASPNSCAGANGLIYQGLDLNGDRDLNDAGEVTLFMDGPNNLTMDYPPASIYGAAAHDGGIAIFQNNGPLGITYRQNEVDFLTDNNGDRISNQIGEQVAMHNWLPDGCFAVTMEAVPVGEFFVPPTASFTPFGTADQTSIGTTPTIGNVGLPFLGQVFEITLTGGIPNGQAMLALGTSNTDSLYGPLPLSLGFIGIPGSTLYTSVNFRFYNGVDGSGNSSISLFVPNELRYAGKSVFFQWQVFDAAVNARGFVLSNAAEAIMN
jgi:hypothetical protein